jgi:hypothetical protein
MPRLRPLIVCVLAGLACRARPEPGYNPLDSTGGTGVVTGVTEIAQITGLEDPESVRQVFIEGGKNGVALDAPKGMAVVGDTLWVADIDVLRGFDRHTGRPVATIDFRPLTPTMLNDVAAGPEGTLRVTDTGILMSDKAWCTAVAIACTKSTPGIVSAPSHQVRSSVARTASRGIRARIDG